MKITCQGLISIFGEVAEHRSGEFMPDLLVIASFD
jgi:hypothetical protein